jgi:hypothetical protein
LEVRGFDEDWHEAHGDEPPSSVLRRLRKGER